MLHILEFVDDSDACNPTLNTFYLDYKPEVDPSFKFLFIGFVLNSLICHAKCDIETACKIIGGTNYNCASYTTMDRERRIG